MRFPKQSIIFIWSVVLGAMFIVVAWHVLKRPILEAWVSVEQTRVLLYDRGRTQYLEAGSPTVQAIISTSEEALTTANDLLRLGVPPETIRRIKEKDVSVEILYADKREAWVGRAKRLIYLDRMLIPLTGEFTGTKGTAVTIFYGVHTYEAGPYTNSLGFHEKILKLLEAVRQAK